METYIISYQNPENLLLDQYDLFLTLNIYLVATTIANLTTSCNNIIIPALSLTNITEYRGLLTSNVCKDPITISISGETKKLVLIPIYTLYENNNKIIVTLLYALIPFLLGLPFLVAHLYLKYQKYKEQKIAEKAEQIKNENMLSLELQAI